MAIGSYGKTDNTLMRSNTPSPVVRDLPLHLAVHQHLEHPGYIQCINNNNMYAVLCIYQCIAPGMERVGDLTHMKSIASPLEMFEY